MYFKTNYLRVTTPVTEDGNRPKIVDGMPVYKETALPLTARKNLEIQNRRLPNHLRKRIEEVVNTEPVPVATKANPVERKKPGPKPKVHA